MIQIIKGTFGYYNGRKVIPITEADGPQKFDDELEARLVKEGVAKYIGELGETAEQPAPAPGDDADEPASTNTAADEAPEYNEDMKLDELKEGATRYGVDASAMRKKADVIAAIEAAKAAGADYVGMGSKLFPKDRVAAADWAYITAKCTEALGYMK